MITIDKEKGEYKVEVHDSSKKYFVFMRPRANVRCFETHKVTYGNNRLVTDSELRAQLAVYAERMVFERLERQLLQKKKVQALSSYERVEVAYAFTFAECCRKGVIISRASNDITMLRSCVQSINKRIADRKEDARKTSQLVGDYLQADKREVLRKLSKSHFITQEKRNFFSTVLARTYSWKREDVPIEALEAAELLLPHNSSARLKL